MMSLNKYQVGPQTVRMLELGHPWVIADRFTRAWKGVKTGEVAALVDERGRVLATALFDPRDRIVARVLGNGSMTLDGAWLQGKVETALALRRNHIDLAETNAWRLINGEGDGLPGLTVDCYGDHLMVQLYAAAWKPYLPLLVSALRQVVEPAGIYEKRRPQETRTLEAKSEDKKYSRLLDGEAAPGRISVRENGLTYLVDLEEGLNTGLFLDMREQRHDIMGRMAGKRFLNLFAYTGAFSVAAAAAGASRVTSVDASRPYLEWARENFSANRLNPKRHEFIAEDCLAALKRLEGEGRRFDAILMDPPSFSTTRKSRFTTRGGTSELVTAALPLLEVGGLLVAASNLQKMDVADYLKELRRGALQADCDLRVIGLMGQGPDFPYPVTFPEGRYLKYVLAIKA